ncbi:hypothetical protein [Tateyamaria sp. SN3-11]|uniref:hypothetical protein n=1 Tax=Tateyamaria sp. SN3-11 TaxID=3092147 RepID=UPI0039EC5C61
MNYEHWELLEVSLAESVLAKQMPARMAIVQSCQVYPTFSVQYLLLALSSMSAALEEEWLHGSLFQQDQLLEVYRTMVALSADIAVMGLTSSKGLQCSDLLTYWEDLKDTFFIVRGSM